MLKIILYHLTSYLTRGGTEISTRPKMSSPISLFDQRELLKELACTSAFYSTHYFAWCYCWRSRDKDMNMILADYTAYYANLKRFTCLADKFSHSQANVPGQHMVSILCDPDKMIFYIKNCMTPIAVFHKFLLISKFNEYQIGNDKSIRLKAEVLTLNETNKKLRTYIAEEQQFRIWINPTIGNKLFKEISTFDL